MSVVPVGDNPRPPNQAVAVIDRLGEFVELAGRIAKTDFVPKAMRGNEPAILAALLMGAEIGLPPMRSLSSISIIEGKPNVSAEAMRALVLGAGHSIQIVETSATRAVVAGCRAGTKQKWSQFEWTIDKAQRAGLATKDVWKRYPESMLLARASTDLCRAMFPDVIAGIASTEEVMDYGEQPAYEPAFEAAFVPVELPAGDDVEGLAAVEAPAPADDEHDDEHDEGLARQIHAVMGELFADDDAETIDRWRWAFAAIITRERPTGPTLSSKDLTAAEQRRVLSLLGLIRAGSATVYDGPAQLVEVRTTTGHWYTVSLDPPAVDYYRGEAAVDER